MNLNDKGIFHEAVDLLNRTQGVGLFPSDYLDLLIPLSQAMVLGAFLGNDLVGVGVAQIINSFDYYLPFDENICLELDGKKVGSFSTLAVIESLQGQGIGQRISHERLQWIKEQGCEVVLGISWVSKLSHTSDRVFEKLGFKSIKRQDDFFKESSLKKPFDCPGCRKAPCECAAILYRLDLF